MPPKVNVEWLKDKCPTPQNCGKCVEVCPSTVFCLYPTSRTRYKASDRWIVLPAFKHVCVSCNKCMDVCPKGAIKVQVK